MNHLMIDIETTGTEPGCGILSIAAVVFDLDTGQTGASFNVEIDHASGLAFGLIDEDLTLQWWAAQEQEVRTLAWSGTTLLDLALTKFLDFVASLGNGDLYAWGNSPSFDIAILKYALKVCGLSCPFNPFMERDYRTHVSFAPNVKYEIPFEGKKHMPLNDALHQVKVASAVWNICNQIQFTYKVMRASA